MKEKIVHENDDKLIKDLRNSDEDLNCEASHTIAERNGWGFKA